MKEHDVCERNDLINEGWELIVRKYKFEIWRKEKQVLRWNRETKEVDVIYTPVLYN